MEFKARKKLTRQLKQAHTSPHSSLHPAYKISHHSFHPKPHQISLDITVAKSKTQKQVGLTQVITHSMDFFSATSSPTRNLPDPPPHRTHPPHPRSPTLWNLSLVLLLLHLKRAPHSRTLFSCPSRASLPQSLQVPSSHLIALNDNVSSFHNVCLLYTSPSPRDRTRSRMPSSA